LYPDNRARQHLYQSPPGHHARRDLCRSAGRVDSGFTLHGASPRQGRRLRDLPAATGHALHCDRRGRARTADHAPVSEFSESLSQPYGWIIFHLHLVRRGQRRASETRRAGPAGPRGEDVRTGSRVRRQPPRGAVWPANPECDHGLQSRLRLGWQRCRWGDSSAGDLPDSPGDPGRDLLPPRGLSRPGMMELVVLGTGTVAPSAERTAAAYWVETGPVRLLMDCGAGTMHRLARFELPWPTLTHVALTHFHMDHWGELPMLFFAVKYGTLPARKDPLTLIGPPGL